MHKLNFYKLKNGINVVHAYVPSFPIALSSFWLRAGSRVDPKGKEGLAHFFEHILTTRTKKFPDRQKRLIEIEKQGFLFNAVTSLENANYYLIHSPENSDGALDLLVDGFTSSVFNEEDIEEEKQIVADEERRNRNDPGSYIWRLSNSGLWPKSQMGSAFFGNQETIKSISKQDVINFYSTHYRPQNAIFLLITPFENINKQLEKLEKIITSGSEIDFEKDTLGVKKDVIFDRRDLNFSQVALSFITTNGLNEKDQPILDLIKNYLASGWMSRLITRLRVQEKLTYWVSSHSDKFKDTGFIRFTASLDKGKMDNVLKIFEEEIILLKNNAIQKEILDQHKNKYKNDILRSILDINFLNWSYGSDYAAFGKKPLTANKYIEAMQQITPKQIQEIANKYFIRENFSLAIIGSDQEVDKIPNFR